MCVQLYFNTLIDAHTSMYVWILLSTTHTCNASTIPYCQWVKGMLKKRKQKGDLHSCTAHVVQDVSTNSQKELWLGQKGASIWTQMYVYICI